MSIFLGQPKIHGGPARTPEPGGAGFIGRAREAASFARREAFASFGSNRLDDEVYEEEIAAIREELGVDIPHPVKGRWKELEPEITRLAQINRENGERGASVALAREAVQRRAYAARLEALKAKYPDADVFRPENTFEQRRKRRARAFEDKAGEAGIAAQLAGGLIYAPADPVTVITAPIGGATAKTVLGAAARAAAANAGVQAAIEPGVQARREEIGLEASFAQGAANVAVAGLAGGVIGGGAFGLARLAGAGRDLARDQVAGLGRQSEDPQLRAGAAEIDADMELASDLDAAGAASDPLSLSAAQARLDAAERALDAIDAGEAPARRDIQTLKGEGEAIPAAVIRRDVAVSPRGRETPVSYAIVSLDDLIASHDDALARNPRFPAELQPRDRGRAASAAQIADIASNLNPRLLDASNAAGDGAPVIRADGVVLSGNGRAIAIARAYERGFDSAAAYRAYLVEQGYPVGDVKRPVLVRIADAMDDAEGFAREANERATAAMSAPEQARADAANLKPEDFDLLSGDNPAAVKNARFIRAVVDRIAGEGERAALMDKGGALSAEGARRVRNAIAAYAYDDPRLIDQLVEGEDELKSLGLALIDAAPDFARLKAGIEAGAIDRRVDVRAHIAEAAQLVALARRARRNVAEYVGQQDMFSGAIDARTAAFLRLFFRNDDFTGARARAAIAEEIAFYAREAAKVDASPALIPDPDPAGRIIGGLIARRGDAAADGAAAPGLFDPRADGGAPSLLPEPAPGGGLAARLGARAGALEAFDDPGGSTALAARQAEIHEAQAEIDGREVKAAGNDAAAPAAQTAEIAPQAVSADVPDPDELLVTGGVDENGNPRDVERRAELAEEFAHDDAIIARLKGCVE